MSSKAPIGWTEIPSEHARYQPFHYGKAGSGEYRIIWRIIDACYTVAYVDGTRIDECPTGSPIPARMKQAAERHHATGKWE